jgi:tRNA(Ile)-lysidine synthase
MEQFAPSGVYNGDVNALDWAKCRGSLQLRNWRPGDQLERADHPGAAVKIKTLFQEYRIPLWERRRWPVIVLMKNAEEADIVWTRKFGAARQFAASADSKSVVVVRDLPVEENQIGLGERLYK